MDNRKLVDKRSQCRWRASTAVILLLVLLFSVSLPQAWANNAQEAAPIKILPPFGRAADNQDDEADRDEAGRTDAVPISAVPPGANKDESNTQQIILQNAAGYILSPGDQITIVDYSGGENQQGSTQVVPIGPDGTVNVYPIGVLKAGGMSVQDFTAQINERSRKFYVQPDFLVYVSRKKPVTVYVLGDVLFPGVYKLGGPMKYRTGPNPNQTPETSFLPNYLSTIQMPPQKGFFGNLIGTFTNFTGMSPPPVGTMKPPLDVLNEISGQPTAQAAEIAVVPGTLTILSALQRAGGLKDSANVRQIKVTRSKTKQVFEVDLWKLLVEGDTSQDLQLESGDIIYAPVGGANYDAFALGRFAGERTRTVRILGSVRMPGLYQLGPDDDIISVITKAGGFSPNAEKQKVLLSRINRDGTVTHRSVTISTTLKDNNYIGREPVRPDDVICVSNNLALSVGKPLGRGLFTVGSALFLIWISNRLRNINVNGTAGGARIAVPAL